MSDVRVLRDQISPAVAKALNGLSSTKRKRFFGDLGEKIVASIKTMMIAQMGWGNRKPYRALKIKWRYHGRKSLTDTAANRGRINWSMAGEAARAVGVGSGQVSVVDKSRVTADSKALIDLADLLEQWGVSDHDNESVTVKPKTGREAEKAAYNDDRGDWDWRKNNSDDVFRRFTGFIDKEVLGLKGDT